MTGKPKAKPFPWRCPSCLKQEVNPVELRYTARVKHDGRFHEVSIPKFRVPQCGSCGELVFGSADEQVTDALRDHLGLMTPAQIRSQREGLGLTQRQLANRPGIAPETVSRWESGAVVQSRASDNLMRVFFEFRQVREALTEDGSIAHLGVGVRF